MPISQFSEGLANVLSFSPGTYATSILRNHAMRGAVNELSAGGVPEFNMDMLRKATDMNIDFFGTNVPEWVMLVIISAAAILSCAVYILICVLRGKKNKRT